MNIRNARFVPVLLLAACSVSLESVDPGSIICATDKDCPNDGKCQLERCVDASHYDVTPPALSEVVATSDIAVTVTFDEPLDDASFDQANFTFTPTLTISEVSVGAEHQRATLGVIGMASGIVYTLAIDEVRDSVGNLASGLSATFNGVGPEPDITPPIPLAPIDGELVRGSDTIAVSFSLTSRLGAASYRVQVALDADFTSVVVEQDTPTPELTVALSAATTYYWRARSSLSDYGLAATFEALGDRIYVYCPSGATCDDSDAVGNLSKPFETVQTALQRAAALRIARIDVARRGNDESYVESVALLPGVSLYGGFDALFSMADTNNHTSIIGDSGRAAIVAVDIDETIVIDGFTLLTTDGGSLSAAVQASDSRLHFTNCEARGGAVTTRSSGIEITSTTSLGKVELTGVTAVGGAVSSGSSYGLFMITVAASVERPDVVINGGSYHGGSAAGAANTSAGIVLDHADASITSVTADSTADAPTTAGASLTDVSAIIDSCRFVAAAAGTTSRGVYLSAGSLTSTIVNTVAMSGTASASRAAEIGTNGLAINSLFLSGSSATSPQHPNTAVMTSADTLTGITMTMSFINNIFVTDGADPTKDHCFVATGLVKPENFFANAFVNCGFAALHRTGTNGSFGCAVGAPCTGYPCSGNPAGEGCITTTTLLDDETIVTTGIDGTSAGNQILTTLGELALSSEQMLTEATSLLVRNGGYDARGSTCGPALSALCNGPTDDASNVPRTPPTSMGPYEYD